VLRKSEKNNWYQLTVEKEHRGHSHYLGYSLFTQLMNCFVVHNNSYRISRIYNLINEEGPLPSNSSRSGPTLSQLKLIHGNK